MDMYKLKFTKLQLEIFRLFCIKTGIVLNQREIAKLLGVSPTAVAKALPTLEKEEIIKVTKGKTNLNKVEINRDSELAIKLKRVENLKLITESGIIRHLYDGFPGCSIVLFGSYSKGEDICSEEESAHSDIDIAIIGTKGKPVDVSKFKNMLEREININFYSSWKEIHKSLKENILNGIILKGGIEL